MFFLVILMVTVASAFRDVDDTYIQGNRCYNCGTNGTAACEQAGGWTSVSCPGERPLCATTAIGPNFRSSLICAPVTKKPCSVQTSDNSSFDITCVCNTHLCNAPFSAEWRNELLNFTFNNTNVKELNVSELFSKFVNDTEEDKMYKAIISGETETVTTIVRSSPQPTLIPVPVTVNMNAILRDSERPRAEPLKQQPTVPSDDDEDESEGSGAYEETRAHNHAVSAPAAPSSFLPADDNSASPLYKNLFLSTLFVLYLVL